jgi:hypothetical protein
MLRVRIARNWVAGMPLAFGACNYWDLPEIYNTMSPFMRYDKAKLRFYWCMGSRNNPEHSLYKLSFTKALKLRSTPVRMVILPKSARLYRQRGILHLSLGTRSILRKNI